MVEAWPIKFAKIILYSLILSMVVLIASWAYIIAVSTSLIQSTTAQLAFMVSEQNSLSDFGGDDDDAFGNMYTGAQEFLSATETTWLKFSTTSGSTTSYNVEVYKIDTDGTIMTGTSLFGTGKKTQRGDMIYCKLTGYIYLPLYLNVNVDTDASWLTEIEMPSGEKIAALKIDVSKDFVTVGTAYYIQTEDGSLI